MNKNQQGLSLLEVLVALLIFSVVVLGFLSVQARVSLDTARAAQQAKAARLLANQAEVLTSLDESQRQDYTAVLERLAQAAKSSQPLESYRRAAFATPDDCHQSFCGPERHAQAQALMAAKQAAQGDLVLTVSSCLGRACLVAWWGSGLGDKIGLACPKQPRQNCLSMEYEP